MTQKEFDQSMQTLKVQYTTANNDLNRRKDEVEQRKQQAIIEADDVFHAEKRSRLQKAVEIRKEKATLPDGDPRRYTLEAEARALDAEISVMRDDNEQRKRVISKKAYDERCALDEESRQLSVMYETEKLNVLEQFTAEEQ